MLTRPYEHTHTHKQVKISKIPVFFALIVCMITMIAGIINNKVCFRADHGGKNPSPLEKYSEKFND